MRWEANVIADPDVAVERHFSCGSSSGEPQVIELEKDQKTEREKRKVLQTEKHLSDAGVLLKAEVIERRSTLLVPCRLYCNMKSRLDYGTGSEGLSH